MYETLPFPRRRGDHVQCAHDIVAHLEKHEATLTGKWLDLGCGTGETFATIAGLTPRMDLLGVDFSQASVALANEEVRRAKAINARVVWGDITDPAWGNGSWDVVSALGSIHHIPEPSWASRTPPLP
jgi:SAM-dependent methyltransferase